MNRTLITTALTALLFALPSCSDTTADAGETKTPTTDGAKENAPDDKPTKAPGDEPTKAPAGEPTKAPADEPTKKPADEPKPAADSPAGTYVVDLDPTIDAAMKAAGDQVPPEQKEAMKGMFTGMFGKMIHTLNEDKTLTGSMEMEMFGQVNKSTMKGTWSLDGDKLTLNTTHQDGKEKPDTATGTYKDGKIQIEKADPSGKTMTLYLVKKK